MFVKKHAKDWIRSLFRWAGIDLKILASVVAVVVWNPVKVAAAQKKERKSSLLLEFQRILRIDPGALVFRGLAIAIIYDILSFYARSILFSFFCDVPYQKIVALLIYVVVKVILLPLDRVNKAHKVAALTNKRPSSVAFWRKMINDDGIFGGLYGGCPAYARKKLQDKAFAMVFVDLKDMALAMIFAHLRLW